MYPGLDASPLIDFLANPLAAENLLWSFIKLLFVIGFGLYIAFAIIVVRQIYLMTATYQTGAEFLLRLLGYLHLAVAVGAFVLALIVL